MVYHNPDGSVLEEKFPKHVIVRFKTHADFEAFCQKIGMKLSLNSLPIRYPLKTTLEDFFE